MPILFGQAMSNQAFKDYFQYCQYGIELELMSHVKTQCHVLEHSSTSISERNTDFKLFPS